MISFRNLSLCKALLTLSINITINVSVNCWQLEWDVVC